MKIDVEEGAKKIMHKRICVRCGNDFQVSSPSKPQRYCSLHCAAGGQRKGEERKCVVCNTGFYVSASQIRRGRGSFCSQKCHSEFQKSHRSTVSEGTMASDSEFVCQNQNCGKKFQPKRPRSRKIQIYPM